MSICMQRVKNAKKKVEDAVGDDIHANKKKKEEKEITETTTRTLTAEETNPSTQTTSIG